MMKKQHYMTNDERQKLEALYNAGMSISRIAKELGFCRQTIYNEIRTGLYQHEKDFGPVWQYSADKAQQKHAYAQTAKGRPLKIDHNHDLASYLESKIVKEKYSPAAALAAARKDGFTDTVCVNTLYSYIDKQIFLHLTNKNLWIKAKKKKHNQPVQRIAHPLLPSITDRPNYINKREGFGHWEMDLVIGKKDTRAVLLTLTERITRQEMIFKLPNRKAETIVGLFNRLEKTIPNFKQKFQSITTDNGSEFLNFTGLVRSIHGGKRFDLYYCHSYAAWEKGSCENHNRMIRRWFPKGTDFTHISQKRINEIVLWMNHYPRKILGWNSPAELAA